MLNKKTARVLISCVTLVFLLFNLTSCITFSFSGISEGSVPPTSAGCYVEGKKIGIITPERESLLYSYMSEEEKMIYSSAYTAISQGYHEFTLKNVDYQNILEVYGDALTAFIYDHPEFFWLSGYVKANAEYQKGSATGNVTLSMGIYEYWNDSDLFSARQIFNEKLEALIDNARQIQDYYDKVKYIHDAIIDMTTYDQESYEQGKAADKMLDAYSNSAYGPLVEGRALCGGYAKLFELAMHRLGYECEYITGTADGGPHAWNLLKLDGEYYHMDVTWDDPDREDGMHLYNYFCVNDAMIEKTHTADPEYKNVKVSSTKYNYHVHESFYLTEYDYTSVENIVKANKSEKAISIRFAERKAKREAVEDLIDNYKFYDILETIDKEKYSYIDNDDLYVLTFIIE